MERFLWQDLFQSPTIEGLAKELQEGTRHLSLMPFQIEGSKKREEQLFSPGERPASLRVSRLPSSAFGF